MSHIGCSRAFTPVTHEPKGSTPSDRSRAFTPVTHEPEGSTPNRSTHEPKGSTPGSAPSAAAYRVIYHNPPHFYVNDSAYIITASTMNKQKYLNNDIKKQILQKTIFKSVEELEYKMFAWVILENHYHILIGVADSKFLGKLINRINGRSSYEINKLEGTRGRKIWYSYWDTCMRNENDFYTRFNYIHSNPVKHGCLDKLDDLASYTFSSYPYYLWTKGKEWCNDIFSRFPIIDFAVQYDDY